MNLRADWKEIIKYAWSMRFIAMAGAYSAMEAVLPQFVDTMPRGVFAGLSLLATIGGAIARVVAQPQMDAKVSAKP